MTTFKLKPCNILVIDVMRRGGESISRKNYTTTREMGKEKTVWESVRLVEDPEELKRAKVLRNKLHAFLHKIGAPGPGHLRIVALDNKAEAEEACRVAKAQVDIFNKEARFSRVEVFTDFFEIADANVEVLENTIQRMDDTLVKMEQAMEARDPQTIRETLREAKAFSEVLPETAATMLQKAVDSAKTQANTISRATKRAKRMAEKIAEELDRPLDGLDLDVELERLRASADNKMLRQRVRKIQKMVEVREESLQVLEAMRQKIDTTPIQLMRYAIQQPASTPIDDYSSGILASRMATREVGTV